MRKFLTIFAAAWLAIAGIQPAYADLAVTDVVASAASNVDTSTTTRTVTLPTTSVETGDIMYILIMIHKASVDITNVLTTPSGWTLQDEWTTADAISTPRALFYSKAVPGGGLGSSQDFTSSDADIGHAAVAFAIQNAVETPEVFGTEATNSGDINYPAVTATNTGGLILRLGILDGGAESSQGTVTAHTAINWAESPSPNNGGTSEAFVAVQPSTTVATATETRICCAQTAGQTVVITEATATSAVIRRRQP